MISQTVKKTVYSFSLLFILIHVVHAQEQAHEYLHAHDQHNHTHPNNEIGMGNYLSFLLGEKEFAYGLHAHYLWNFANTKFGAGIGYEQIFDEHQHKTITAVGTYRPVHPVLLSFAPGILLPNKEESQARFALHIESVYEFEIGNFHLGPAIEFATSFDESHISIGAHIGLAF